MRRMLRTLVGVAVGLALWNGASALAQEQERQATPAPAERRPAGVPAYYSTIAKELALQGEQREAFLEKVRARQRALQLWDQEHKQALDEARAQRDQARSAGDTQAQNTANAKVRALQAERRKIENEGSAAIKAVLTPEQLGVWGCYNSYTGQLRRFGKADLTPEQKAQVKTVCMGFAAEMAKIDQNDRRAMTAIRQKMSQAITEQVLTDAQRQLLDDDEPPAQNPEQGETHEQADH